MRMRHSLLTALCLAAMLFAPRASAVDYPNSPVSVIVGFNAGGGTDIVARALVDAVKGKFPRGIAVENRSGGGGSVGMSYGQNSKPDGNVITMVTVELINLPHVGTGGDVSPDKFIPICLVNSAPASVSVKADSPYKTLKDLLDASKTTPLQVGNSGIGAIWHLSAAALEKSVDTEFVHIPFQGAAPAITALLGGHIDFTTVSYAEVSSQVAAGEVRVLAILSDQRIPDAPDVPTAKELGYDVSVGTWRGLAVPLGTPPEIVKWLEETFAEGCKAPSFVKIMKDTQNDIDYLDSKAFAEKIKRDDVMFGALIKSLGLAKN